MAGVFDHLHLKRNTAGSSNELSFDVLDAARTGLDQKKRRRLKLPRVPQAVKEPKVSSTPQIPTASRGSYRGTARTTTVSREAEVERRKKARRARRRHVRILAATLVLAVLFVLLWFGYRNYLEVQDFDTRFTAIVNQFVEEDEFLAAVDDLMETMDDGSRDADRIAALERIPVMNDSLARTSANARAARSLAVTDEDRAALDQVTETAEARAAMIESARNAFVLAAQRGDQAKSVNNVWNDVVSAWQEAKEAAVAANNALTEEETTKAREQTKSVLDQFQAAGAGLKAIDDADDRLDLSAQTAYVEKRAISLQAALDTADALLAGDRDLAKAKNDEYNKADNEAAELAKKLPTSPEETVKAAYAPDIEVAVSAYEEARSRVVAADSLIRDYLDTRTS